MPSDVPFAEIRKVLEAAGYSLTRIKGSHHIFTRPESRPFAMPVHRNRVKAVYLRQAIKLAAPTNREGEEGTP